MNFPDGERIIGRNFWLDASHASPFNNSTSCLSGYSDAGFDKSNTSPSLASFTQHAETNTTALALCEMHAHIPTVVGHPFRFISDSHSNSKRTPVPIDIGQ